MKCLLRRFWSKVDVRPDGCWWWTGAIGASGYPHIKVDGKKQRAHRIAYELFAGPVPDGFDVDHLCGVRKCVNPSHLEAVTHRENVLRGDTFIAAHHEGRDCGHAGCRSCRRFRVGAAS